MLPHSFFLMMRPDELIHYYYFFFCVILNVFLLTNISCIPIYIHVHILFRDIIMNMCHRSRSSMVLSTLWIAIRA
jgi:hypothetical protein